MKVCYYPDVDLSDGARPVVTLGNFDGLHLGHQKAMALLRERARELDTQAVAVTFEPHPVSVLRPDMAPKRILSPKLKQEVIGQTGIDVLVVVHFTESFSQMEPDAFVEQVLIGKLRASEIVLGEDFHYGRDRGGNLDTLRLAGERFGFIVHRVQAYTHDGGVVSSTRIRQALASGDVDAARAMLGRPHFLEGVVERGDGRGRLMGFPTANIRVDDDTDVLLGDGVYVTQAVVNGDAAVHNGMTHVGSRPTFGLEARTVETHLFDFDREIYGQSIRLFFWDRVRGTVRFDSADGLRKQLGHDQQQARAFFERQGRNLVL